MGNAYGMLGKNVDEITSYIKAGVGALGSLISLYGSGGMIAKTLEGKKKSLESEVLTESNN